MSISNLKQSNNLSLFMGSLTAKQLTVRQLTSQQYFIPIDNGNVPIIPLMSAVYQKSVATQIYTMQSDITHIINEISMFYQGSRSLHNFGVGSIYRISCSYTCLNIDGIMDANLEVLFGLGATSITQPIGEISGDHYGEFIFDFTVTSYNGTTGAYTVMWTYKNKISDNTTLTDDLKIGRATFTSNITGVGGIVPLDIGIRYESVLSPPPAIQFVRGMALVKQIA